MKFSLLTLLILVLSGPITLAAKRSSRLTETPPNVCQKTLDLTSSLEMTGDPNEIYIRIFVQLLSVRNALPAEKAAAILQKATASNPVADPLPTLSPLENRKFREAFEKVIASGKLDWEKIKIRLAAPLEKSKEQKNTREETAGRTAKIFALVPTKRVWRGGDVLGKLDLKNGQHFIVSEASDQFAYRLRVLRLPDGAEVGYAPTNWSPPAFRNSMGREFHLSSTGVALGLIYNEHRLALFDLNTGAPIRETTVWGILDGPVQNYRITHAKIIDRGPEPLQIVVKVESLNQGRQKGYYLVHTNGDPTTQIPEPKDEFDSRAWIRLPDGKLYRASQDQRTLILDEYLGSEQKRFSVPDPYLTFSPQHSHLVTSPSGDLYMVQVVPFTVTVANLSKGTTARYGGRYAQALEPEIHESPTGKVYVAVVGAVGESPLILPFPPPETAAQQSSERPFYLRQMLTLRSGRTLVIGADDLQHARRVFLVEPEAGLKTTLTVAPTGMEGPFHLYEDAQGNLMGLFGEKSANPKLRLYQIYGNGTGDTP